MMRAVVVTSILFFLAAPAGAQVAPARGASWPLARDAERMERALRDAGSPMRRIIEAGNNDARGKGRTQQSPPLQAPTARAPQLLASTDSRGR